MHIARKLIISALIMLVMYAYVYFKQHSTSNYQTMASVEDRLNGLPLAHKLDCSDNYSWERKHFPKCSPVRCGRFVSDSIVSEKEATELRILAETVFSISHPSGGVAIFDLHTGALSNGTKFVNLFELIKKKEHKLIKQKSLDVFGAVKDKLAHSISFHFGVSPEQLHLTSPVFFTRITNAKAVTLNDQYYHAHVDKQTYGTFVYTSLIYLSTYKHEFTGGRFIFLDGNRNVTIEPKFNRVSAFTSAAENSHMVEPVASGVRIALTIPFTCDLKHAIKEPSIK